MKHKRTRHSQTGEVVLSTKCFYLQLKVESFRKLLYAFYHFLHRLELDFENGNGQWGSCVLCARRVLHRKRRRLFVCLSYGCLLFFNAPITIYLSERIDRSHCRHLRRCHRWRWLSGTAGTATVAAAVTSAVHGPPLLSIIGQRRPERNDGGTRMR